jgi:predicted Rossmann-fold nucleotide-binding protein
MGLLDVAGYWQPLMAFLQHAVDERFLAAEHLKNLLSSHDAVALLDLLASHQHRTIDKWLDRTGGDQAVPNTRSPASPNPGRM